jgi:hypothetical protein
MPPHDLVGDGKELPVRAFCATNPGFLADSAHPLVAAGGLIARMPGFTTLEASRIQVVAAAKERSKERNLVHSG